jgi:hypothetical protein
MKSEKLAYKMQFYCRGVARIKVTPQFVIVIYLLFRVVENHTFYRSKIREKTYQKHV